MQRATLLSLHPLLGKARQFWTRSVYAHASAALILNTMPVKNSVGTMFQLICLARCCVFTTRNTSANQYAEKQPIKRCRYLDDIYRQILVQSITDVARAQPLQKPQLPHTKHATCKVLATRVGLFETILDGFYLIWSLQFVQLTIATRTFRA